MEKVDPSKYFIITICTHDKRANAKGLENLFLTAMELANRGVKDHVFLNISIGSGLANTRTQALDQLRSIFKGDEIWTFWLDSDISIGEKPENIANYVIEAEKTGLSFAGATRTLIANFQDEKFRTNAFKDLTVDEKGKVEDVMYTDEELINAKPFELKLRGSGLALCYIKTPLDYVFHTEGHCMEDSNFYNDLRDKIDLRYCHIDNGHDKTVELDFSRAGILSNYRHEKPSDPTTEE